jgi:hypothetical protein
VVGKMEKRIRDEDPEKNLNIKVRTRGGGERIRNFNGGSVR